MDIILETEPFPEKGESMDSLSWGNYPGGKGGNMAVAAYRASHKKRRACCDADHIRALSPKTRYRFWDSAASDIVILASSGITSPLHK